MSGTGDAAWMRDLSSQSLSQEFYLDIRWDTDNFYSSTANTFTNDIDATEFDKFQMLLFLAQTHSLLILTFL